MKRFVSIWLVGMTVSVGAGEISLPSRPAGAPDGAAFAKSLAGLPLAAREQRITEQIKTGNVPDFWRRFAAVRMQGTVDGVLRVLTLEAAPDYLAVGSDADYFLTPLSPETARTLAEALGCVLPTRRMVDAIYAAAPLKLKPRPLQPGPGMTTLPVFLQHNDLVFQQRRAAVKEHPLGELTAGHKKDVVVSPLLTNAPGKVAIYGWHRAEANPIQPLYLGHTSVWVDYSHGVRLVKREATLDGEKTSLTSILADEKLSILVSDEGPLPPVPQAPPEALPGEQLRVLPLDAGIRVALLRPDAAHFDAAKPVLLTIYALPNGNSLEQTLGRKIRPGDDWHFDVQHIAAQTRWLRPRLPDVNFAVACIECAEKSWPAWRKNRDPENRRIPQLIDAVKKLVGPASIRLALTSHSGGGAFVFGCLDSFEKIPDDVRRIAFLDSNYAYNSQKGHAEKLAAWLAGGNDRQLCVMAYHDSIATLNGKPFVSESGGTWGRSHAMQQDLAKSLPFTSRDDATWERHSALEGRIQFLLHKNPTRAILHTRLVEWNGFIHAMLAGTALAEKDYQFGGPRVYNALVADPTPAPRPKE